MPDAHVPKRFLEPLTSDRSGAGYSMTSLMVFHPVDRQRIFEIMLSLSLLVRRVSLNNRSIAREAVGRGLPHWA